MPAPMRSETLSKFLKPRSAEEKAVGIQDKGQVTNLVSNFGDLSNWHTWQNDALHWPRQANAQTHYSFGLGLIVAVKRNVISSVGAAFTQRIDWVPKDGSRGKIFSGEVTAPPPDETPFQAFSDNPDTWPRGYFDIQGRWVSTPTERHWPGFFRIDVDPASPRYGQEVQGEFASDRDIYCVFDDSDNPNGAVGIEVEQTSYSYGRPYAEDFLFFDFTIHNKSGKPLDSVYVGYYAVFRPDYDFKDYLNIIDSNPTDAHPAGDFVYVWDKNNQKDGAWAGDPTDMGMVGLLVLATPKDLGVTDFHYFNREVTPTTDEQAWAIITSNPNDPNLPLPSAYFHGSNRRMDDTSPALLQSLFPEGAAFNFYIMTGPVSLAPGETVKSSIATVMGSSGPRPNAADTTDLMKNMRLAQKLYERKYQGSGPPKPPVVKAYPGDRQVRLVWTAEPSESSVDPLTGKKDFEGYRIYRSTDKGKTWGTPITDRFGNVIGYKPIKVFDKIDGILGPDPAANQVLGNDTGLKHSYIDENLVNGVEYWYCVTAYDQGNQNPDSLEQSYEYPLGRSTLEPHTVSAVPGPPPANYVPPRIAEESLVPIGGVCQGIVRVDIVDPSAITGHRYQITFTDSAKKSTAKGIEYVTGFDLVDLTTEDTLIYHHLLSDESEDNLPIVDGFRLTLVNTPSGVEFIGWTKVVGDTCTFDWRTKPVPKYQGRRDIVPETVYTYDDYRITVDTTATGGLWAHWYDYFTETDLDTTIHLPLKVHVVTDPAHPIDVSNNTWLFEFAVKAPWEEYRQYYYSPLGWDLVPGGKGYVKGSPGYFELYTDILNFEKVDIDPTTGDTVRTGLYLFTNNFPDEYTNADGVKIRRPAVAPSHGDEFTIRTYKPFRKGIRYEFTTIRATALEATASDLDKIRVVPDPYIVSNAWETTEFGKKLMFNHLPGRCTISIYTVAGDHVRTLEHNDSRGYTFWDMRTVNDQNIAYGLYIYVVTTPNGQKKVGRFLVIK